MTELDTRIACHIARNNAYNWSIRDPSVTSEAWHAPIGRETICESYASSLAGRNVIVVGWASRAGRLTLSNPLLWR